MRDGAPEILGGLLLMTPPEVRAAAVFALGCLLQPAPDAACAQPEVAMPEQVGGWAQLCVCLGLAAWLASWPALAEQLRGAAFGAS